MKLTNAQKQQIINFCYTDRSDQINLSVTSRIDVMDDNDKPITEDSVFVEDGKIVVGIYCKERWHGDTLIEFDAATLAKELKL